MGVLEFVCHSDVAMKRSRHSGYLLCHLHWIPKKEKS